MLPGVSGACLVRADMPVFQITLVIWAVIRIGPNGCDSMEFHESGLLRFKQVSDMGVIHPLYKSTVGGRRNENLVITGNNQPVSFHTEGSVWRRGAWTAVLERSYS